MTLNSKKFLDSDGLTYFAQLLNNYPDNEVLASVIDAISDALDEKIESPNIPYLTCATGASTAAKTTTLVVGSFTEDDLVAGAQVLVKFTSANSKANPTLSVNGTTAKAIMRYGTTAPSTSAASSWNAGAVVLFVYDGTYWQMEAWENTTYSSMTVDEITAGTGTTARNITPARLKTAIETWAPVKSVNGDTGSIIIDKIKTTAGEDNVEYNLLGTVTTNTNNAAEEIYNPSLISFSKLSDGPVRLTLGNTSKKGQIRLYGDPNNGSGYIDLISNAENNDTIEIELPLNSGTLARTADIPDVKSWALAANKPSYTFSELTSHPTSLSGYGITDTYTKTEVDGLVSGVFHYKGVKATVSALPSSGNTTGDVWHITADGSEHAWDGSAWQELGSNIDFSGYVPTSTTINGKALTGNISLTASDVSALPSNTTYVSSFNGSTGAITYTAPVTSVNGQTGAVSLTIPTIPTNVSDFTNDAGYLTSYTETDPTVPSWAKASTKPTYTASEVSLTGYINWSTLQDAIDDIAEGLTDIEEAIPTTKYVSSLQIVNRGEDLRVNYSDNTYEDVLDLTSFEQITYSLSISGNRITLTPSSGTASYVDLPVYDGGVS